jgi:hypothetical protein
MSDIIWATRADGARMCIDLDSCIVFNIEHGLRAPAWLYYRPSDGFWVLQRRIPQGSSGKVVISLREPFGQILSAEEAAATFREAGMPLPPELNASRKSGDGTGTRLRERLELILEAFNKNPGPLRAKEIAKLAQLNYDQHVRADLSELKGLGFLHNDGRGYMRTDKPYPAS